MQIQFNTDKNVEGNLELENMVTSILSNDLKRFEEQITRLEVHVSDEDGPKNGLNEMRCLLEARLEGRPPIAVTNTANTEILAVKGAVTKLKNALETSLGRLKTKSKTTPNKLG